MRIFRKLYIAATLSLAAIIIFTAVPANTSAHPVGLNNNEGAESTSEEILVKFYPYIGPSDIARIHSQCGGKVKETIPTIGVQVVSIPQGKMLERVKAYSSYSAVSYAEPNYQYHVTDEPNDDYFSSQWGLNKIEAPEAWDITKGSNDINIAILDTGIDVDHPDLTSKIITSVNLTNSPNANDIYGHGTHVAGIAAACTNNTIGVAGIGCDSTIMNVKVMNDSGFSYYSWIADGIIWAADNGAEVINLSLGGLNASQTMEEAIQYAWSKGAVIVAAAGNSGSDSAFYPAYYEECIAVAATDTMDNLTSWSNRGEWVDVAAPGLSIYSTLKNDSYGYKSGTSMASPHVAGLAALLFSVATDTNGNGFLNDEVRSIIEGTADNIGSIDISGGRINAVKAVEELSPVSGSITGNVKDTIDNTPVEGVIVSSGNRSSITDINGDYTISNIPDGNYTVTTCKEGYQTISQETKVTSGGNTIADFALMKDVPLLPGTITGKVKDATDGIPIAGVKVSDGTRSSTTDMNGYYTIFNVPDGSYNVTVSKEGYQTVSQQMEVTSGGNTTADFATSKDVPSRPLWVESITLNSGDCNLYLTIHVICEGDVVAGANLELLLSCSNGQTWKVSGTADNSGNYSYILKKAADGSYLATINSVSASGYMWDTSMGIQTSNYYII